jgi:hypothetical protein
MWLSAVRVTPEIYIFHKNVPTYRTFNIGTCHLALDTDIRKIRYPVRGTDLGRLPDHPEAMGEDMELDTEAARSATPPSSSCSLCRPLLS